jgi:hypothetical protein
MGCKRVRVANRRAITGTLVSSGFSFACAIRFTLPLGKAITMGATALARRRRDPVAPHDHRAWTRKHDSARPAPGSSRAVAGRNNRLGIWEIECARHASRAGFRERGRRRTRQDQISREAWRPGEIAELGRSAPNEENLFLLPDRFSRSELRERRSSRLT